MTGRSVLLVAHTGREAAVRTARGVGERLCAAGIEVRVLDVEAAQIDCPGATTVAVDAAAAAGAELVFVLGGDGTLLRAAELARPAGAALLGVNLGRVGFLAEAEPADIRQTVAHVLDRAYSVEERMTLDVDVERGGEVVHQWALNDVSVEKAARERLLDLLVAVDGRPLSRWGCDGVVVATPTGSTAYAFSAGGPIVWPNVQALLCVPISAHALFNRPVVVGPDSVLTVEMLDGPAGGLAFCDGRRTVELGAGARVVVRRGALPVRLARLHPAPFTDRLVAKFALPVHGWRGDAAGEPPPP